MSPMFSAKSALAAAFVALGLTAGATIASAEDRTLDLSYTAAGTSDYVFRGVSLTREDPAFQASIDATYGIAYVGVWGSNVDFGGAETAELDFYGGFKPVWKSPLGDVHFDLGVIYYAFPNVNKALGYAELKGGYTMASPWIKNLTTGTTLFWATDYRGLGEVVTVESMASYALPQVSIFTPTLSGIYGSLYGDRADGFTTNARRTEDDYSYWNIGLTLAVEKFAFDFRYWDSDLEGVSGVCTNAGLCDERFVFTAKVTLP